MTTKAVVLLIRIPSVFDALISQPPITYGSAAFPVPPTTPFAEVKAEFISIRIWPWFGRAAASTEPATVPGPLTKSVPHAMMAARATTQQRTRAIPPRLTEATEVVKVPLRGGRSGGDSNSRGPCGPPDLKSGALDRASLPQRLAIVRGRKYLLSRTRREDLNGSTSSSNAITGWTSA